MTNYENLIPPSPDAAQTVKYADFPVLYSLGVPEISIPVYTVKNGTLTLPISFSYHASGIKVDEIAGVLGLGWNLEAGGTIAKTVIGMPDDGTYGPTTGFPYGYRIPFEYIPASTIRAATGANASQYFNYLYNVFENRRDSRYDRYSYNFGGYSGTFFIIPNAGSVPEIIDLSGSDLQFECLGEDFKITTPDGTRYNFTPQERVSRKQSVYFHEISADPPYPLPSDYETISSWRVSRIVAANGNDVISFTYEKSAADSCTKRTVMPTKTYGQRDDGINLNQWFPYGASSPQAHTDTKYACAVLKNIIFPGGTVTFNYTFRALGNTPELLASYPRILSEVIVKNSYNQQIRKYNIIHSISPDSRHGMKAVEVYGQGSELIDRYDFSYYSSPGINRNAQDYFGYYNGKHSNTNMLFLEQPAVTNPFLADTTKRQYHFQSAIAGSLYEISRLRGERTVITYGKNSCPVRSGRTVHIGIRVESIGVFDGRQLIRRRNFEYRDPVLTMGFIPRESAPSYITASAEHSLTSIGLLASKIVHTDKITVHENTVLPGTAPEEQKVFYRHITERGVSGDGMETYSVDYYYDSAPAIYPSVGSCPYFPAESNNFNQPRHYVRTNHLHNYYLYEFSPVYNNLIRKVTNYAHETTPESGLLKTIEETVYENFRPRDFAVGLYVRDILNYAAPGSMDYQAGPRQHRVCSDFVYTDIMARATAWKPVSTKITSIYRSGSKEEHVSYDYNDFTYSAWPRGSASPGSSPGNLLLKSTTRTLDGSTYLHRLLYTTSYPLSLYSLPASVTVVPEWNFGHLPAGEEVYKDGSLLYGKYTLYGITSEGFHPHYTVALSGSDTISRYRVHEYANGRPFHISEEGEVHTCLIWDAGGEHLLAEVRNATAAQVRAYLGQDLHGDPSVLRTALPAAQVTTWTYLPLVGVTSITDPSGRTVTYDYDNAWRLKSVKDEDGNILETYEYKNL
jgi:YD repeat-containing protein